MPIQPTTNNNSRFFRLALIAVNYLFYAMVMVFGVDGNLSVQTCIVSMGFYIAVNIHVSKIID